MPTTMYLNSLAPLVTRSMSGPACFEPLSRTAYRTPSHKSSKLDDELHPPTRWVDMTCHASAATHFRFQLVGCELMTCGHCTRHFLTPTPSTVVCPRCHRLIDRSCHLDYPSLFDMERLLLGNGLFFAGCPTSVIFMRLKMPRQYAAADDEWSDVLVFISDTALRIYDLDNSLTASFGWGSLSLHFAENSDTPEMVLKDHTARHIISAPSPAIHRWLKSRILNKLRLYSSQTIINNSFTQFCPVQVPTELPKPAKPAKDFFSRLRNGKFLRKRETPFSPPPCPAPRSEALMAFSHRPNLSQKPEMSIFLHRLASRSLPSVALACASKKGSRISTATFSTQSSANSTISSSPSTSNLGLDFLFSAPFPEPEEPEESLVNFLLQHPTVYPPENPHNWKPVARADAESSFKEADTVAGPLFLPHTPQKSPPKGSYPSPVLDSPASLVPQQVRTQIFKHLKSKSAVHLRSTEPPTSPFKSFTREIDALLDEFPTPPNR
ncbi:hypothetical protein DSO57_1010582 [Entomophthora muscae]|uniref:Uncharacterized protein n=1 Tax=Entomophthora muscae TaxID=34485 RepID=A0ACC2UGA6_9FUNG|nr:hypothetical protein DSO57_1010582 [Entomophthora muscae]